MLDSKSDAGSGSLFAIPCYIDTVNHMLCSRVLGFITQDPDFQNKITSTYNLDQSFNFNAHLGSILDLTSLHRYQEFSLTARCSSAFVIPLLPPWPLPKGNPQHASQDHRSKNRRKADSEDLGS